MTLEWTGETLIPEEMWRDPRDLQCHLARYVWAIEFCHKKVALDAACGAGYGSMILSWVAHSVLGVDRNPDCIEYALDKYRTPNNFFQVRDVTELQLPAQVFDVVVSFETIEHLNLPHFFLGEIWRVLKPDGVLICSAPENSGSKFHVRDYSRKDLTRLLASRFPRETMRYFCQGPRLGIVENGEPVWEHPTHILICPKQTGDRI